MTHTRRAIVRDLEKDDRFKFRGSQLKKIAEGQSEWRNFFLQLIKHELFSFESNSTASNLNNNNKSCFNM